MDPEFESVFSKTMAQLGNPPPEVQAKYRKRLESLYPAAKQIKAARDKEASEARKTEAKAKAEAGKKELELMGKTDWGSAGLGLTSGATFGALPALYGAASAIGEGTSDLLGGNLPSLENLKERYVQTRDVTQEELNKAKENPEFYAGDVAGNVLGALAPVGAGVGAGVKGTKLGAAVAQQTLKEAAKKGLVTGAVTGGVEGAVTAPLAMESPKGEFLPLQDLLLESAKGGAVGTAFGGALGGLGASAAQRANLPLEGKIKTETLLPPREGLVGKAQTKLADLIEKGSSKISSPVINTKDLGKTLAEGIRPGYKKTTSYLNPEQYPTIKPEAPKNVPAGPLEVPVGAEMVPAGQPGEFAPFDLGAPTPGRKPQGPQLTLDLPEAEPLPPVQNKLNPFEPSPFKLDIQEQLNLDKLRREAAPPATQSLVPETEVSPTADTLIKPKPTGRESARIKFLEPVFDEAPKAKGFSKVAEPVKTPAQSLPNAMQNVEKAYGSLENIFEASRSGDPVASQYIEALAQSFEGGTAANPNATQVVSFPELKAFELKTQPQRKKLDINLDLKKTEPELNAGSTLPEVAATTAESAPIVPELPAAPVEAKTSNLKNLQELQKEVAVAEQPKPTLNTRETFSLQGEKYGKGEDKSAAIKEIAGKIKSSSKSKEELTALIQETIAKYNIQPDSSFMKKLSDQIARKGAPPGKRGRPKKAESKTKETPALTKEEADKAKLRKEAIMKKLMEEE
jgi:hypothetical protein